MVSCHVGAVREHRPTPCGCRKEGDESGKQLHFRAVVVGDKKGQIGVAKELLRPASPGTGVIAGGAVRIMLEMAGVENRKQQCA
ncbi:hypothetical protein L1987_58834 [Smallanthus sonchifolius]|uniref:Uncharacterized protein n=1 Tax=Smallanthus sonchifolius TaxID=185202 RepID=A0ACB9D3M1_9ASTR|nr:hypothetical protein L1987_58834 [Smallanthus sonchifolius]